MLDKAQACALVISMALLSSPTEAGRVGEINKKVSRKTTGEGRTSRRPQRPTDKTPPKPRPQRNDPPPRRGNIPREWNPRAPAPVSPMLPGGICVGCYSPVDDQVDEHAARAQEEVVLDIYLAGQKVANSDGSFTFTGRLAHGLFGIGASVTNYYEETSPMPGVPGSQQSAQLRLWSVNLQGRAFKYGDETELWVQGGYTELQGTSFENLSGFGVGANLLQRFSETFIGRASAQSFWLEDELRGHELSAHISAAIFSIGYRYMNLNLGPPLYGPELGLSARF